MNTFGSASKPIITKTNLKSRNGLQRSKYNNT